jgi:outer membrane protein insertion porin family
MVYRSNYNIEIPIISDTNTLTNSYNYKIFHEFLKIIFHLFHFFKSATSITGDDVKLSERLSIPSNKLRGFETW